MLSISDFPVTALIGTVIVVLVAIIGRSYVRNATRARGLSLVILIFLATLILFSPVQPLGPNAQAASSSFSFAAAGDYSNFWSSTGETRKVVTGIAASGASFAVALGDLAYSDSASTARSWCANYKALFNNVVIVSGNHDSGEDGVGQMDVYNQACPYSIPGVQMITGTVVDDHGTSYGYEYAFDYPASDPVARIILIVPQLAWKCCGLSGTYTYSTGSANYNWVSARIDEARAKGEWVIVGWHKTKGEIGSDLKNLLLQKHVDLVLAGHDHEYKRTYQLKCWQSSTSCIADTSRGTYKRGAGFVYVLQGTGGAGLFKLGSEPILPPGAISNTNHGFVKYTISATSLSGQFISVDSSYTDSFTISSVPSPLAASFTVSPASPGVGQLATFTGSATGGVAPYSFGWNFGDGGTATGSTPSHAYSNPGSYTVTLTVKDSTSATATSTKTVTVQSQSQTSYTFRPTDDTYVRMDTPSTNYGSSTEIATDTSPVKDILLKFNVQVSGTITGATLRLYQIDSSDKGGDFHTAPATWSESTATWSNAPAANPTVIYSLGRVTSGTWYDIPLSTIVTANGVISFRVTSSSTTGDGSHFASKENNGGLFAAQLIVTTSS